MRLYRLGAIGLFLAFLTGCNGSDGIGQQTVEKKLEVASHQMPCSTLVPRLCMLVQFEDQQQPSFFYESIQGFDYIWGHSYQLRINETTVLNPPEDGSSQTYQLQQVISDREDPVGARYIFELVDLTNLSFYTKDDGYFFLGKPFECLEGVDCDGLVALSNSGGLVNVTFDYVGQGNIRLVEWN